MKKKMLIACGGVVLLAIAVIVWGRFHAPQPIPVGIICGIGSGAVLGSSELNAADLFLEEQPRSRIQPVPLDDQWNPDKTVPVITDAMARGVKFFIGSHPSKCAVASVHLFATSSALVINPAATSPALTGKDDYFLRIIADGEQEQRAIARFIHTLPGKRLLVLQDDGNLPYTDPAFAFFSEEMGKHAAWQFVCRKLTVAKFQPQDFADLMAEPFDALYILAGSFQAAIGNIAQLFHYHHPDAPILLTPWSRSPAILETAGPAISQMILPSQYPPRFADPAFDGYFNRFKARFGYEPHAMTIGVRKALELLDHAFEKGHVTPEAVKTYLLTTPAHQTSLGRIVFDQYGDVSQDFYFIRDVGKELQ